MWVDLRSFCFLRCLGCALSAERELQPEWVRNSFLPEEGGPVRPVGGGGSAHQHCHGLVHERSISLLSSITR